LANAPESRTSHPIGDAQILGRTGEGYIGSPQLQSFREGGGEQMNVDPTETHSVQAAMANQRDHLVVRNDSGLVQPLVGGEKLATAVAITDQQFSVDQLVPGHLIAVQKSAQLGHVSCMSGKRPNPSRCVYQDH
jgi:hypothetical protein